MSDLVIPARARAPRFGLYPERTTRRPSAIETAVVAMQSLIVVRFARLRARQLAMIAPATLAHEARLQTLDDTALRAEVGVLRPLARAARFRICGAPRMPSRSCAKYRGGSPACATSTRS